MTVYLVTIRSTDAFTYVDSVFTDRAKAVRRVKKLARVYGYKKDAPPGTLKALCVSCAYTGDRYQAVYIQKLSVSV